MTSGSSSSSLPWRQKPMSTTIALEYPTRERERGRGRGESVRGGLSYS